MTHIRLTSIQFNHDLDADSEHSHGEIRMVITANATRPNARDSRSIYRQRHEMFASMADMFRKRTRIIGHLRLLSFFLFVAGIVIGLWEFSHPRITWLVGAGVAFMTFVGLVIHHSVIYRRLDQANVMAELNTEAEARRCRDWAHVPTPSISENYGDSPTARDLDLFGPSSLMQLVGPIHLPEARNLLARWFLHAASMADIHRRQEAIAELAPKLDHRQEYAYTSRESGKKQTDPEDFYRWSEGETWLDKKPVIFGWVRALLGIELLLIILHATAVIPYPLWILMIVVNMIFTRIHITAVHGIFDRIGSKRSDFRGYANLLRLLEKTPCTASLLADLKAKSRTSDREAASELKMLDGLIHLSDVRHSGMLYGFLQGIFLWDFHILKRLEQWQRQNGVLARQWIDAIAEYEALCSLSSLKHDHPDWVFPDVREDRTDVVAAQLGHPLLVQETCVRNDVTVGPPGSFFLVTGSNMSGKSTLLRAIGVNVVLALAGGPVCAESMVLCPVVLGTSFRVKDSLAEGISYYMAELLRLKEIISMTKKDDTPALLYLFDEILMGTNIVERQSAVRKVIRYLVDTGAIGVLATHDLTIADARELRDACRPVHFTEQFVETDGGEDMVFDYVLRHGVAKSSNALKMLKMVDLMETT